jgi:hypothetical protein
VHCWCNKQGIYYFSKNSICASQSPEITKGKALADIVLYILAEFNPVAPDVHTIPLSEITG